MSLGPCIFWLIVASIIFFGPKHRIALSNVLSLRQGKPSRLSRPEAAAMVVVIASPTSDNSSICGHMAYSQGCRVSPVRISITLSYKGHSCTWVVLKNPTESLYLSPKSHFILSLVKSGILLLVRSKVVGSLPVSRSSRLPVVSVTRHLL